MNLTPLTDEQISVWIAEKLEPPVTRGFLPTDGFPAYSKTSHWICRHLKDGWQPRDFVNDAEMTVILLEKLLDTRKAYWLEKRGDDILFERANTSDPQYYPTLGRAVAEAFMLAHGYQETGE